MLTDKTEHEEGQDNPLLMKFKYLLSSRHRTKEDRIVGLS